jgi:hypothetical protein
MPPKRTLTIRQDSPSFADPGFLFLCQKRLTATLPDWRLRKSGARVALAQACARCLRQTSIRVGSRLCPMRTAGRSTTICIRPLAIRRSLVPDDPSVTRRPFGKPVYVSAARTSPRRDVTVVSLVSLYLSSCCCVLNFVAWGSGVGSAGVQPMRNTQADGAPKVPGAGGNRLRRRLLLSPPSRPPWRALSTDLTSSRRLLHFAAD